MKNCKEKSLTLKCIQFTGDNFKELCEFFGIKCSEVDSNRSIYGYYFNFNSSNNLYEVDILDDELKYNYIAFKKDDYIVKTTEELNNIIEYPDICTEKHIDEWPREEVSFESYSPEGFKKRFDIVD